MSVYVEPATPSPATAAADQPMAAVIAVGVMAEEEAEQKIIAAAQEKLDTTKNSEDILIDTTEETEDENKSPEP